LSDVALKEAVRRACSYRASYIHICAANNLRKLGAGEVSRDSIDEIFSNIEADEKRHSRILKYQLLSVVA